MKYEINLENDNDNIEIILIADGSSYCPKITWFIEDCSVIDLSVWEEILKAMKSDHNEKKLVSDQHGGSWWEMEVDQPYFKLRFNIGTGCGDVKIENNLMINDMIPIIEKIIEIYKNIIKQKSLPSNQ